MDITIIRTRGNDPVIHTAGCADISRCINRGTHEEGYDLFDVTTQAEVIADWWQDIIAERISEAEYLEDKDDKEGADITRDMVDLARDVQFMPCCKTLETITGSQLIAMGYPAKTEG